MTTKKFSMIREAQTLARVGKGSRAETLKDVQQRLGVSLSEAAELFEDFSSKITPEDYDIWIHQVIAQAEMMKEAGDRINLNRRQVFNDLLGEVLENDPKFSYDEQLFKHVADAVWRRYQSTRDHLKAQNVMKAREDEEAMYRAADASADEELNINQPPMPEETDEFEPSSGNYDAEDMSGDELPRDDAGMDDDIEATAGYGDDEDMPEGPEMECPYDEGTPECDAWMAGYEAAMSTQEEPGQGEDEVPFDDDTAGDEMGDDEGGEMSGDDYSPMDLEQLDRGEDVDGKLGDDEMDHEELPQENEEDVGFMTRNLEALKQRRAVLKRNPKNDVSLLDAMIDKHELALKKARQASPRPEENEEVQRPAAHWINRGYLDAKAEYHHGRKSAMPKDSMAARAYEQGYESFMKDTEGQRDLQRRGAEDEEGSLLKSIINKPKETLNQALKDVEAEGSKAFDSMTMPKNPHPNKSLAQKAWAKGFKNAVRNAFGFEVKPAAAQKKRKK